MGTVVASPWETGTINNLRGVHLVVIVEGFSDVDAEGYKYLIYSLNAAGVPFVTGEVGEFDDKVLGYKGAKPLGLIKISSDQVGDNKSWGAYLNEIRVRSVGSSFPSSFDIYRDNKLSYVEYKKFDSETMSSMRSLIDKFIKTYKSVN